MGEISVACVKAGELLLLLLELEAGELDTVLRGGGGVWRGGDFKELVEFDELLFPSSAP